MRDRNSVLAWLARSAARALFIASCSCRRSVMSSITETNSVGSPRVSRISTVLTCTHTTVPSGRM